MAENEQCLHGRCMHRGNVQAPNYMYTMCKRTSSALTQCISRSCTSRCVTCTYEPCDLSVECAVRSIFSSLLRGTFRVCVHLSSPGLGLAMTYLGTVLFLPGSMTSLLIRSRIRHASIESRIASGWLGSRPQMTSYVFPLR